VPIWAGTQLTDVLSHVWLDSHTQDRHALRLVLEAVGPRGVVLGGDYPVTAPELGMHNAQAELDTLDLSAEVRRKIERDNALALLGVDDGASES
jgi:predicted TIM-barrel fold metal-dependent hydrolase